MTATKPRAGSLQFWPRKRAEKEIPSVNWNALSDSHAKNKLLGFICYKAGMKSVLVKDNTANSMTKGKQIVIPSTVVECPPMKVFSIRFYKNGNAAGELISNSVDKELIRKLKLPKTSRGEEIKDFDDVRLIVYSVVKSTEIKKTPDIAEIGINGTATEKLEFAKSLLNKEINFEDFFDKNQIIDVRGLTKGKGYSGAVSRFGINLKPHKSEKGIRRPGTLGPWHPARVTFHVPMSGQLGMFTRVQYNNKLIAIGKNLNDEIKHYGFVKNNYCLIKGSVQGVPKRAFLITAPLRPTKKQSKLNLEFLRVLK